MSKNQYKSRQLVYPTPNKLVYNGPKQFDLTPLSPEGKPRVKIQNCYMAYGRLYGDPIDYPESHEAFPGAVSGPVKFQFTQGRIQTSAVVSLSPPEVHTRRTIYEVQNWLTLPTKSDEDAVALNVELIKKEMSPNA